MLKLTLYRLKFSSYLKLCNAVGVVVGICFGILMFIMSLFGGDVNAHLGPVNFTGISAGIASLFIGPLVFVVFGLLIGLVSFLPLKLALKLFKGLNLYGEFNIESQVEQKPVHVE